MQVVSGRPRRVHAGHLPALAVVVARRPFPIGLNAADRFAGGPEERCQGLICVDADQML